MTRITGTLHEADQYTITGTLHEADQYTITGTLHEADQYTITGTLHEADQYTLLITSRSFIRRMRNVSDKSCRENQNPYLMLSTFFRKS